MAGMPTDACHDARGPGDPARRRDRPRPHRGAAARSGTVPGGPPSAEDPEHPRVRTGAALRDIAESGGAVLVAELSGRGGRGLPADRLPAPPGPRRPVRRDRVGPRAPRPPRSRASARVLLRDAIARARRPGCYRVQLTSNAGAPGRPSLLRAARALAVPRRLQDGPRVRPARLPAVSNHVIS